MVLFSFFQPLLQQLLNESTETPILYGCVVDTTDRIFKPLRQLLIQLSVYVDFHLLSNALSPARHLFLSFDLLLDLAKNVSFLLEDQASNSTRNLNMLGAFWKSPQ